MFRYILKKLRFLMLRRPEKIEKKDSADENTDTKRQVDKMSEKLSINLSCIKNFTGNSNDIIFREFNFGHNQNIKAALVFVDGLASTTIINENIIEPLMYKSEILDLNEDTEKISIYDIEKSMLSVNEVKEVDNIYDITQGFFAGDTVLIVDGLTKALVINSKGWERRSVSEPITESVIRGPREGFTENLRTNTSLLRRKIKSPLLTMESLTLGEKTKTSICLAYLRGVANDELIKEIKKRLSVINTDAILESGYIEQYIEDSPFSIFPTLAYTEKPDVVAAKVLEGRAAILVDGTPFVLTAPMLFVESFQTAEDYYTRPYFMSMLRVLRCLSFLISILAPAFYVTVTTFHQELIPTDLLFTMADAREGIPFPAVVEAGIMILAFEILREAGIRLPRPVGSAISIVGALIMGDAAVSAGLIGAPMVIVIAITSVSIFAVPTQADSAAILRIIMLILGATMGGFGLTVGMLFLLVHLASLKSFGFAYLAPLAPFQWRDNKDAFIRAPLWAMTNRPNGMAIKNKRRQGNFIPLSIESENKK